MRDSEDLKYSFPRVLNLALTDPRFKNILDNTTAKNIVKLADLVFVAEEALEPEQLADMVEYGQFERILALPQDAFEILTYSKDPALVIAWANLAGETIIQVVETRLYELASPEQFRSRGELETGLTLGDVEGTQMGNSIESR